MKRGWRVGLGAGESANGKFPTEAVQTMARIVRNADMTASTYIHTSYLRSAPRSSSCSLQPSDAPPATGDKASKKGNSRRKKPTNFVEEEMCVGQLA